MTPADIARVKADPRFRELERKRGSFSWTLCIIMLVIYLGFILLLAFGGKFAATPIWGVVTIAFPIGLFVILSAIVLTGIYVIKANGEYDDLNREIVASLANRPAAPGQRMAA